MDANISTQGYIFITIAWGSVTALLTYCLFKVLRPAKQKTED